jgi:hypothetical protein
MHSYFSRMRGALAVCAILLLATLASAQSTAQISGTIRDQSGAVLPGADVTVTQTNTGASRSVVSNADGFYTVTNLPLGPYRVEANLSGFQAYSRTGLSLQVGADVVMNIVMGLSDITETVSVTASAPLVETRTTAVGQVMETERIMNLPLNGRNAAQLIELAGVPAVQMGEANSRAMPGGLAIAVAGGEGTGTGFMLDGAIHNDLFNNMNLPLPFPDALQEFRVETGSLPAQYGMRAGAAVSAVTKSGTNRYTGESFLFLRDHRFNATNPFSARGPDGTRQSDGLQRQQYGGTLGGPIVQNRLFAFSGYQGTRARQAPTTSRAFVPTPAMMAGDFSAFASPACNAGRQVALRAPFVNNQVSPSLFSPAALKVAAKLPATTDPCGEVRYGLSADTDEWQLITRLDFQQTGDHSLFGRYMATSNVRPIPFQKTGNLLTTTAGGLDNLAQSMTVGSTYVISSTMVNALRITGNRTAVTRPEVSYFSNSDVGIKVFDHGIKQVNMSVTGGFGLSGTAASPAIFQTTSFQLGDDMTIVRGSHQVAFGANTMFRRTNTQANVRGSGNFAFNGQTTGLGLADFLLGNASSFVQGGPNLIELSQVYAGAYAADTIRLSSRVTANVGIRWDPFFPQQMLNERIYMFDYERFQNRQKSTVFPNAGAGLLYPGDEQFVDGRSGIYKQWGNVTPRAGVAWDVQGDGQTSLRAGYSKAYNLAPPIYFTSSSNAPPWGSEVRLAATSFDDPWRTYPVGNPFPVTIDRQSQFAPFGAYLVIDPEMTNTNVHSWDVSLQQAIGRGMVSATYIGNHTSNLWNGRQLNPGVFLGLGPCVIAGVSYPVCSTNANLNQRRKLSLENPVEGQLFGYLNEWDASGTQDYHAVLFSARVRSLAGMDLSGNYTVSTCEGHIVSDFSGINVDSGWNDPNNPDYDRGPCLSNRRHLFNATVGAETPQFDNATARAVASGWRVSGIVRGSTGTPINVLSGLDRSMTGIVNQRPDQVLDDPYGDRSSLDRYLNAAAFAQPALGTLGNVGAFAYEGPGRWSIDLVLAKLVRFGATQRVELRAEAFNVTNNFMRGNPVVNFNDANFGRILTAGDPRILQFGVKYGF